MGYIPQKASGDTATALSDFTSGVQIGNNHIIPEGAQLTTFMSVGTIAATAFPTGTTIGDDVTNGLKITIDGTDKFIPLLSTIS